jgi:hypothetical protein
MLVMAGSGVESDERARDPSWAGKQAVSALLDGSSRPRWGQVPSPFALSLSWVVGVLA